MPLYIILTLWPPWCCWQKQENSLGRECREACFLCLWTCMGLLQDMEELHKMEKGSRAGCVADMVTYTTACCRRKTLLGFLGEQRCACMASDQACDFCMVLRTLRPSPFLPPSLRLILYSSGTRGVALVKFLDATGSNDKFLHSSNNVHFIPQMVWKGTKARPATSLKKKIKSSSLPALRGYGGGGTQSVDWGLWPSQS